MNRGFQHHRGRVWFVGCGLFCWVFLSEPAAFCAKEEAEKAEKEENAPRWVFEQRFPPEVPPEESGEADGDDETEEPEGENGDTDESEEGEEEGDEPDDSKDEAAPEEDRASLPRGFDAVEGTWGVREKGGPLSLAPEPLVEGRVEFGPEQREIPATIVARASGRLLRPLSPRMGVGLYGKNGFQLRFAGETDRVELVRRREVLVSAPCAWEEESEWLFELSVTSEGEDWIVAGRVWKAGKNRPGDPMVRVKAWGDELLFPLAGRPALVATAFSGAPVHFYEVRVSGPGYDPAWLKREEEEDEEATGDEEDVEEENSE